MVLANPTYVKAGDAVYSPMEYALYTVLEFFVQCLYVSLHSAPLEEVCNDLWFASRSAHVCLSLIYSLTALYHLWSLRKRSTFRQAGCFTCLWYNRSLYLWGGVSLDNPI
jgi:hypothetical protein